MQRKDGSPRTIFMGAPELRSIELWFHGNHSKLGFCCQSSKSNEHSSMH